MGKVLKTEYIQSNSLVNYPADVVSKGEILRLVRVISSLTYSRLDTGLQFGQPTFSKDWSEL